MNNKEQNLHKNMYTVSNELSFHGAETEFALICKTYPALKIWAHKMVKKSALRLEYIWKKQCASLFLYSLKERYTENQMRGQITDQKLLHINH